MDCSGRVLLLGNGGAARAMAFEAAVRQRDLDLTVACRESSQPKAVALAQEVAAFLRERGDRAFRLCVKTYEELEEESLPGHSALGFDLLLNATSVGMYPNTGESPVSVSYTHLPFGRLADEPVVHPGAGTAAGVSQKGCRTISRAGQSLGESL